jgi:hypothetical protein
MCSRGIGLPQPKQDLRIGLPERQAASVIAATRKNARRPVPPKWRTQNESDSIHLALATRSKKALFKAFQKAWRQQVRHPAQMLVCMRAVTEKKTGGIVSVR